jgi:hypothetical protein
MRREASSGRQRSSSAGAGSPRWNECGCDGNVSRDDCGGGLTDQGGARRSVNLRSRAIACGELPFRSRPL